MLVLWSTIYDSLAEHPWVREVLARRRMMAPSVLDAIEEIHAALRDAGLPIDAAVGAYRLMWNFTLGSLLVRAGAASEDRAGSRSLRGAPDAERYPILAARRQGVDGGTRPRHVPRGSRIAHRRADPGCAPPLRAPPTAHYHCPMSGERVPGGVVHKLPADLREALIANATALDAWKDITPLARNEFICWVEDERRRPPESGGFGGPRRSWRKGSAGPAAGRGAITGSATAGSGSANGAIMSTWPLSESGAPMMCISWPTRLSALIGGTCSG